MPKFARHALGLTVCLTLLGWGTQARAEPPAVDAQADAAPALQAQAQAARGTEADPLQQWLDRNGLVQQVSQQVSSRTQSLVSNAMGFIGVRYRYGGDRAASGFDCSGFVRHVYEETLGMVLPHNAAQQSREGERVDVASLRPGDLVFFHTLRRAFSHVGIYIGNGEFIHAPRPGEKIQVANMSSPYWAHRFNGARRLIQRATDMLPSAEAAPAPAAPTPVTADAAGNALKLSSTTELPQLPGDGH